MANQYLLPVIHPAFELLKRSSRILHFIGASIILVNGLFLLQDPGASRLSSYLQLIIAAEIYLVIVLGKMLQIDSPVVNIFFRAVEAATLLGIAVNLLSNGSAGAGYSHLLASFGYFFLLYRECRILHSEFVDIRSTGIIIPNFVKDEEISWPEIKNIAPGYHTIVIETFRNKKIEFELRKNLKIEELQQIDEFCRQHLIS